MTKFPKSLLTYSALNNNLVSAFITLTSNAADIVGGYKLIGNIVFVDMRVTPTNIPTEVSYRQVLVGLPVPIRLDYVPLSCVSIKKGQSLIAVVGSGGELLIKEAEKGVAYYIGGCYIKR